MNNFEQMDLYLNDEDIKRVKNISSMTTREDFCYFIDLNNKNEIVPCRPIKINETNLDLSICKVSSIEHGSNFYRLYSNGNGVFKDGNLHCSSIAIEEEKNNFLGIFIYNVQEYEISKKNKDNFWEWYKNCNETRWVHPDNLSQVDSYDSKNIMHCIRLLISGINIMKNGEPIIHFTGEQKDFLMNVRNGKYEYDYIMNIADEKMKELEEIYNSSTIPYAVDMKKIDDLYLEVLDELDYLEKKS